MGMITQLLADYTGEQFKSDLIDIIIVIVGAAGALMTLYAIYIGYLFATATDEGKRRAAKSRLWKIISSAFIIFALASVMAVIKVNFGPISPPESEKGMDNLVEDQSAAYEYTETPTLHLTRKNENITGEFTLDVKNLKRKNGEALNPAYTEFKNFSFLTNGFSDEQGAATARTITVNNKKSTMKITYKYWNMRMEKPCKEITVLTDGSTDYIWATFSFANTTGLDAPKSVKFKVKVTAGADIELNKVSE